MAQQTMLWTVLPAGQRDGRWAVSIVASPRLTPQTRPESLLGHAAWREWADWPKTLAALKFQLEIGSGTVDLRVVTPPELAPSSAVWSQLFHPALRVAPFQMLDLSQVNLRSFPLRPLMRLLRTHYQRLSADAGGEEHPLLLPWRNANPLLKGLLGELGTRTVSQPLGNMTVERMYPGFTRFHAEDRTGKRTHEKAINDRVFNANSCIKAPARRPGRDARSSTFPLRALPPDWEDPALIRNGSIQVAPADREARAQLMEQFSGPAEYALWQADRFYNRVQPTKAQRAMRVPSYAGIAAPIEPPEFDFHQRIASYGDHPNLLRQLGLVIDCVMERNSLLDALMAANNNVGEGFMRLKLVSAPPHSAAGDQFPFSAFRARSRRFVMQSRTGDHGGGMLRLQGANDRAGDGHSPFDLYQIDPDGAALKTTGFLLTAQNLVGRSLELGADGGVTYTTGDRQPVSSLRSGGIGVSRHGRAGGVGMHAATAALNDGAIRAGGALAAQLTLFAEDVMRGYRVDVRWRDRWHSLVQREVSGQALPPPGGGVALPVKLPADEGHVKGASTTSPEPGHADHYLHETLFRWSGWSLAAPRPGRHLRSRLVGDTQIQQEEVVDEALDAAPKGNGLAVQVQPRKGTLPRLRFGQQYAMRARIVDLAGNSLALEGVEAPGDDEQASDALRYGRFEPVEPPALVLRRKLSEGESPERVVLRSSHNASCGTYAQASQGEGQLASFYDNPDFEYGAQAERHWVPPKAAQQLCELHGMFDAAIGSGDPEAIKKAYATAARESGSLMHPEPGAQIELVTPTKARSVATVQGQLPKPPELADDQVDRLSAGQYLIHREALVPIPYLPDPASGGISLLNVPGLREWMSGKPDQEMAPGLFGCKLGQGARAVFFAQKKQRIYLLLDFDRDPGDDPGKRLENDWPHDVRSLRLVVEELPDENPPACGPDHAKFVPPKWDFDQAELRVYVPKGFVVRMRYASFVHDRLANQFALPFWQDDPATRLRVAVEGLAGCNWMLTPWRPLTLVHATQKPVCEPTLSNLHAQREPGWQHADLGGRHVLLHGPSTGHFEIVGEWEEWVDQPLSDTPGQPGPKRVKHEAVLTAIRLHESHANQFLLDEVLAEQNAFAPVGGQVTPPMLAQRPAVPGNRHEFGDTRFRFVQYRLRATTRFREYLPPELYADPKRITREGPVLLTQRAVIEPFSGLTADTDPGAPVRLSQQAGAPGTPVFASAPPDVPEVVYIVPTFRWHRPEGQAQSRQSTRLGNGLRVYLERPWFSSGDGELLGVVIQAVGGSFAQIDAARLPYVSQWGQDPLWDGSLPNTVSDLSDFGARVADEMLRLQEQTEGFVHVVGHRVQFDAERKLWFADIEINPGLTYMPFVRLALVRYQPHAISGAKVSRVVMTEFAQLLPRRHAVLELRAGESELSVHGPAPKRGPMRWFSPGGKIEPGVINVGNNTTVFSQEDGRNRMELVLQQQEPGIDSELGWTDLRTVCSAKVGGDPATRDGAARDLPADHLLQPAAEQVNLRTRSGQTLRFDRLQQRPGALATLRPEVLQVEMHQGPDIWRQTFRLLVLTPNRKHRLMLREFERFYTDRTVPVPNTSDGRRRVVVEERLVYAEVFEL